LAGSADELISQLAGCNNTSIKYSLQAGLEMKVVCRVVVFLLKFNFLCGGGQNRIVFGIGSINSRA